MNYRHIYHAGSFADVFKHAVVVLLVQSLLSKEKPFCYLDSHAGIGLYDLQQATAQKTREYATGLLPLLRERSYPALLKPYLAAITASNNEQSLPEIPRYYPGSPCLVSHLLRANDRMVLNELHQVDVKTLKQVFQRNKQVSIQQMDAYQAIKAFLPPKERRGLVLIDPAYEQPNEYDLIIDGLLEGLRRWETGIYAVWYPIKDRMVTEKFLHKVKTRINKELLVTEMTIYPEIIKTNLNGSGMLIINPPWQLDTKLNELVSWLWKVLSIDKQGQYRVEFL